MRKEIQWHIVGVVARRIALGAVLAAVTALVDVAILDEQLGDAVRRVVELLGS